MRFSMQMEFIPRSLIRLITEGKPKPTVHKDIMETYLSLFHMSQHFNESIRLLHRGLFSPGILLSSRFSPLPWDKGQLFSFDDDRSLNISGKKLYPSLQPISSLHNPFLYFPSVVIMYSGQALDFFASGNDHRMYRRRSPL